MLDAMDVSQYFLSLIDDDAGDIISNMKMQKLLYYAQGLHLACNGQPLFREQIEAWTHGPVVESVYHEYKKYKNGPVPPPENFDQSRISPEKIEFLNDVYEVFGQFSAWKLRNMTHDERPWKEAAVSGIISQKTMTEHFADYVIDGE